MLHSLASLLLVGSCLAGWAKPTSRPTGTHPALQFNQVEFIHRWTRDDQREFTPPGQEDLAQWTDMLTLHYYRKITEGEGLASMANIVIGNYKKAGAIIVRSNSVPRTAAGPAEHLIVALFPQPDFIEASFVRFKLTGGIGSSVVYCHRLYGKKIGSDMSAWLQANGPPLEKALMSWAAMPALDGPGQ